MFMGTPHQGGEGVAWGKRLVNVASIFVKTNDRLLNILERDSEILQQQLGQYNSISGDFETKFAFETKATPLAFGKAVIVVPKSSAVVPGHVGRVIVLGDFLVGLLGSAAGGLLGLLRDVVGTLLDRIHCVDVVFAGHLVLTVSW
jgi:hypothetical protein